jgi:hypothetical protein
MYIREEKRHHTAIEDREDPEHPSRVVIWRNSGSTEQGMEGRSQMAHTRMATNACVVRIARRRGIICK